MQGRNFKLTFLYAALVFLVLFSVVFVSFEKNHECEGEDCPVCLCINITTRNLSFFAGAFILKAFADIFLPVCKHILKLGRTRPAFLFFSPVLQKIRLNN
ncbi:hypothetical protein [Treponema sp.]|uniref:hypothetical protein n=1 Tax=Treponema sp. TaxID=166 RepID=UPI003F079B10